MRSDALLSDATTDLIDDAAGLEADAVSAWSDVAIWSGTVPRQLVHKRSCSEVYLTSWRPDGGDACEVGAQWPRRHSYYTTRSTSAGASHDLLLAAETLRQAVIYTAHQLLGVPLEAAFSMNGMSLHLRDGGVPVGQVPTELILRLDCQDVRRDRLGLRSMTVRVEFFAGDEVIARGHGDLVVLPQRTYSYLRRGRTQLAVLPSGPGLAPEVVGRRHEGDVLIDAHQEGALRLRIDTTHPVLFDHPLDHVPGMLLIEAARQAVTSTLPSEVLLGFEASFQQFTELDEPCDVHVVVEPGQHASPHRVVFEQGGEPTATVVLHRSAAPSTAS